MGRRVARGARRYAPRGTAGTRRRRLRRAPAAVAALVAGQLPIERLPVDAEHARRAGPVVADRVEHAEDVPPLDLRERHELARALAVQPRASAESPDAIGEILDRDLVAPHERDRAL